MELGIATKSELCKWIGHQDHWRTHHQDPSSNAPLYEQGDSYPSMFTCLPWSWYSPWTHYYEYLHSVWTVPKSYTCDWPSWMYQN
jgi:hypothetical protein